MSKQTQNPLVCETITAPDWFTSTHIFVCSSYIHVRNKTLNLLESQTEETIITTYKCVPYTYLPHPLTHNVIKTY